MRARHMSFQDDVQLSNGLDDVREDDLARAHEVMLFDQAMVRAKSKAGLDTGEAKRQAAASTALVQQLSKQATSPVRQPPTAAEQAAAAKRQQMLYDLEQQNLQNRENLRKEEGARADAANGGGPAVVTQTVHIVGGTGAHGDRLPDCSATSNVNFAAGLEFRGQQPYVSDDPAFGDDDEDFLRRIQERVNQVLDDVGADVWDAVSFPPNNPTTNQKLKAGIKHISDSRKLKSKLKTPTGQIFYAEQKGPRSILHMIKAIKKKLPDTFVMPSFDNISLPAIIIIVDATDTEPLLILPWCYLMGCPVYFKNYGMAKGFRDG